MIIFRCAIFPVLFSVFTMSFADVVKIETNTWSDRRPLRWTGTLTKIDASTGIASFEYKNRDQIKAFTVHVTRIYSLVVDSQDRVNKPFPPTRQDLNVELTTNPRSKRILELSNANFVADDIPTEVRVRPDRNSLIIYLNGNVISADLQKIALEARVANRGETSFEIQRSDLRNWIR